VIEPQRLPAVVFVSSRGGLLHLVTSTHDEGGQIGLALRQTLVQKDAAGELDEEAISKLMEDFVRSRHEGDWERIGWGHNSTWTDLSYGVSKLGVNLLNRAWARKFKEISFFSCTPGYVRTDMTGPEAPKSVEEGADTPSWLAYDPPFSNLSGSFFGERKLENWDKDTEGVSLSHIGGTKPKN